MAGLIKSAMPVVSGVVCVSEATGVAGRSFGRVAMITTLRIEERRVASRLRVQDDASAVCNDVSVRNDLMKRGNALRLGTGEPYSCLLYTSPSPRDGLLSRMPSSA